MSVFLKRWPLPPVRPLLLVAAVVLALGAYPVQLSAQPVPDFHYEFEWIHEPFWERSEMKALTKDGLVLGQCLFFEAEWSRVFVWRDEGQGTELLYLDEAPTVNEDREELGQFRAFHGNDTVLPNEFHFLRVDGMNDTGQIVGYGYYTEDWPEEPAIRVAFRWTPPDENAPALLEEIAVPSDWGTRTNLHGINNAGDILGTYSGGEEGSGMFLYIEGQGFVDLGPIAIGSSWRRLRNRYDHQGACWIQFVASRHDPLGPGTGRTLRYTYKLSEGEQPNPGNNLIVEDLGTLRSDDTGLSGAGAINDLGQIAGAATSSDTNINRHNAYRYCDQDGMVNLGAFTSDKDGYRNSVASGINILGDTVGISRTDGSVVRTPRAPFLYTDDHGMLDLRVLTTGIPWDSIDPEDASVFIRLSINDSGEIVGQIGSTNSRVFRLRPVAGPSPVRMFAGAGTPMTIADPHPRLGPRETNSTVRIAAPERSTARVAVLLQVVHSDRNQLSAALRRPGCDDEILLFPEGGYSAGNVVSFDSPVLADGDWTLVVRDHVRGDTGTLDRWNLIVEFDEPPSDNGDPGDEPGEPDDPELDVFVSTDTPLTIADAHPRQGARETVSTIRIENTGRTVESFELSIDISHNRPDDLSGKLVNPSGQTVKEFSGDELVNAWDGQVPLGNEQALDGSWQLILRDEGRGDRGTLNEWAIFVGLPQPD